MSDTKTRTTSETTDATNGQTDKEPKEWTLMFYMSSDNPLAPNVVSQLKAIKSAGFHDDVNVIVQFDPSVPTTPTHIFDVNLVSKILSEHKQPDPRESYEFCQRNDPYIRNLVLDRLLRNDNHERTV